MSDQVTATIRALAEPNYAEPRDELELQCSQHAGMLRRLDARDRQRQAEIHQLRRDTSANVAELSEQMDRITDVLRRHGIDPADRTGETVPAAR